MKAPTIPMMMSGNRPNPKASAPMPVWLQAATKPSRN
jgi:hypothetical protein